MSNIPPLQSLLDIFQRAALMAGEPILQIYKAGPDTRYKSDASPVTDADERAEAIILGMLSAECPDLPVVAEESAAAGRIPDVDGKPFLLVDPLDGTKEFINGHDDFTVNIGLIVNGAPILGFVYAPALGLAYSGGPDGAEKLWVDANFKVTRRQPMRTRMRATPDIGVTSRWSRCAQTDAFLSDCGASDIRMVGSSLKFCLIAEGAADIYPRFGRTMEWDTAAGDAVLRAAGGMTFDFDGHPLTYGKTGRPDCADFANPHFVARCAQDTA